MRKLKNLQPERVFYYFEEISKIPRESGNEQAISDFLVNFAKANNLEVYRDKMNNVIIKKPASKGYENSLGIILQGHMDMVCVKEADSTHNFLKDPIDLILDGNFIRANKTTLGADNGIAVAMGLAVLEDKSLEHPKIELLVTTEEETTMGGALSLEKNVLTGKYLINIDSEEEGYLTAGCAGGKAILIQLKDKKIEIEKDKFSFYKLELTNLYGGHSGAEIHQGRLNSHKVMNEVITELKKLFIVDLVHVEGGVKDNAIPRENYFKLAVENEKKDLFKKKVLEIFENTKNKYKDIEKNINFSIVEIEKEDKIFSKEFFENYLNLINEIPTGVNTWMEEYPTIVESSDNLAIVRTNEDVISIKISLRSSEPKVLDNLTEKIVKIIEKYKGVYEIGDGYPEWKFRKNSILREKAVETYKKLFNENMEITVIHAGLECGAISKKYPDLDMISIGPNMADVHTPYERLEIKSTEKYYKYLLELLKNLK